MEKYQNEEKVRTKVKHKKEKEVDRFRAYIEPRAVQLICLIFAKKPVDVLPVAVRADDLYGAILPFIFICVLQLGEGNTDCLGHLIFHRPDRGRRSGSVVTPQTFDFKTL